MAALLLAALVLLGPLQHDDHKATDGDSRASAKRTAQRDGFLVNDDTAQSKDVLMRLSQPVSLHFKETPLDQVFGDLRALSGLNIILDKFALVDAKVDMSAPFSLSVDDIALKAALNIIRERLKLAYFIKDGLVYVTTPKSLSGPLKSRVYAVGDLLTPGCSSLEGEAEELSRKNQPLTSALRRLLPSSPESAETAFLLQDLITTAVAPESWEPEGHGRVQFFPLGAAFVISHTEDVLEQVEDLLFAVRRFQDLAVMLETNTNRPGDNDPAVQHDRRR